MFILFMLLFFSPSGKHYINILRTKENKAFGKIKPLRGNNAMNPVYVLLDRGMVFLLSTEHSRSP